MFAEVGCFVLEDAGLLLTGREAMGRLVDAFDQRHPIERQ
jgi:hypothetical protein